MSLRKQRKNVVAFGPKLEGALDFIVNFS